MITRISTTFAALVLALAPLAAAHAGGRGKAIYEQNCATCHQAGLMGSPRVRDKGPWKARVAQGIPTLTTNVINGLRAMPPRGGCDKCTDQDLKLAVEYMVKQSHSTADCTGGAADYA